MKLLFLNKIRKILILLCFGTSLLQAQEAITVSIDKITVGDGGLDYWIKCTENGRLKNDLLIADLELSEWIDSGDSNKVIRKFFKSDTLIKEARDKKNAGASIVFLLELSNHIDVDALNNAKTLIKEVLNEKGNLSEMRFYLSAFNESKIIDRLAINLDNVDQILAGISTENKKADFYRLLVDEIKFLNALPAEEGKALFYFGSGQNETEDLSIYQRQIPYEADEIKSLVKKLPYNFRLFPVLLHNADNDPEAFSALKGTNTITSNLILPKDYADEIGDNVEVLSNYVITGIPNKLLFQGEERTFTLSYGEASTTKIFRLGSVNYPVDLQKNIGIQEWLLWLALGGIIILLIFGVGSLFVPFLREREFKRKYVVPYMAEEGRIRYDVFYNEPIEPGELVVKKCRQITPLSTWKDNNWTCPNHPNCLNQNCNGSGGPEAMHFSSMEGIYLKINWILFGAIGGLIAWVFISLFRINNLSFLDSIIEPLIGVEFLKSVSSDNPTLIAQTIGSNVLVGIAFGFGLLLMLSLMEERRASNRHSWSRSFIRVAIRTLVGIVAAIAIFFLGFYLQYVEGINVYLAGLFTWLLFGLAIGSIMSIYSTISAFNGVIGGVIAALVAFHIYYGLSEWLNIGYLQTNLFSLILLGGLIGSIMVSIVRTLEDFELEVIAPSAFQRTIPISKWLKSNIAVMIGKSPGSYIYVKWPDDAVSAEHAELFLEDNNVYLRPVEEVLKDGVIISKPVALKDGDIIQLGRASVTQMKFVEK